MGVRETADAVARLLPRLTPPAVLLTDDRDGAVELLAAALSARRALEDAESARRALVHQVLARPRWSAEQVIESSAPAEPADEDGALAAALRALPDRQRAAIVLGEAAPGEVEEATGRLMADLARRDEDGRRERGRVAELYRAPGSAPSPDQPVVPLPERLARLAEGRPL